MPDISAFLPQHIGARNAAAGINPRSSHQGVMRTTPDQTPIPAQSLLPPPQSKTPQPYGNKQATPLSPEATPPTDPSSPAKDGSKASGREAAYTLELSRAERQVLQQLKSRDREVKAHEQAHLAAGGQYVQGGANYSYRIGPDGKMYAVGGEVSINE